MLMVDGDPGAGNRRALQFLRRARELRGLSPEAIESIARALERGQIERRPRPLLLAVAAVVVALFAGATFAAARVGWRSLPVLWRFFAQASIESKAHVLENTRPWPLVRVGHPATSSAVVTALPTPPSAEDAASVPATPNAKRVSASSPNPPADSAQDKTGPSTAEAPTGATDSILEEGRSFAAALELWHRDRSGAAALAALDVHERRYLAGRLWVETRLLRAEILLAQGRQGESLALLDQVSLAGKPRARELFTVRGELRIKLGRCADGRADLNEVLGKGVGDDFAKRATRALAHCP